MELFHNKPYTQSKCFGDKIDLWNDVEFGLPVERKIDGDIRELIIEPDHTGRSNICIIILESDVCSSSPKPGKSLRTESFVYFQQSSNTKTIAKRNESFNCAAVSDKIFCGERSVEGRDGVAESYTHCEAIIR